MRSIGREDDLERLNRHALHLAREVADENGCLIAGNLCNSAIFSIKDEESHKAAKEMFKVTLGLFTHAPLLFFEKAGAITLCNILNKLFFQEALHNILNKPFFAKAGSITKRNVLNILPPLFRKKAYKIVTGFVCEGS